MEVSIEKSDCPNCRRLEEEKAQVDACVAQWARENVVLMDRLTQAEAREAAIREALVGAIFLMQSHKFSAAAEKLQSVLSPDAGRALAAKVETLREVVRAAKNYIGDSGMTRENLTRLEDALATLE